jgi:RNA polymerase sigma factor (sigma-70 family)
VSEGLDEGAGPLIELGSRLKVLMTRCGVPSTERDDCIQEVWLALLMSRPEKTLKAPATRAWLLGVGRKKALDFHRGIRRRRSCQLDQQSPERVDPRGLQAQVDQDTGEQHEESQLAHRVWEAVYKLSKVNREILVGRARDGLDYAYIAELVALTPGQVRARYCWVLGKLRRELAARPEESGCVHALGGGSKRSRSIRATFRFKVSSRHPRRDRMTATRRQLRIRNDLRTVLFV